MTHLDLVGRSEAAATTGNQPWQQGKTIIMLMSICSVGLKNVVAMFTSLLLSMGE